MTTLWLYTNINNIFLSPSEIPNFLDFCLFVCFCLFHGCIISKSPSNWGIYLSPFLQVNLLMLGIDLEYYIAEFLHTSTILAFKVINFFHILSQPSFLLTNSVYDFVTLTFFISTFLFYVPRPLIATLSKIFPRFILEEYKWASRSRIQLLYWAIKAQICNKIIFGNGTDCVCTLEIWPGEVYANLHTFSSNEDLKLLLLYRLWKKGSSDLKMRNTLFNLHENSW